MSPKKALVLGTLLLVPVLVFLFLSMFGVNKFSLRTYFPARVDSTLVQNTWQYDTVYHQVPDFQLTTQMDTRFSQKDLEGKVYVAHFFSTPCSGQCKLVTTQLSRVYDAFRFKQDVRIISFAATLSPENTEFLKKAAANLKADPKRWIFLTGTADQIQVVAEKGFKQPTMASSVTKSDLLPSGQLILVDKQRHIRGIYDATDASDVDRLITELNVLISMYDQDNAN